ncbi:DUF4307 domain-containing protein [Kribbella deserti]|uniref:DUF4307 domain-containing protein n=1 Tax=Kribbella deserti TaxID=1926257 RepID=A0ABV6QQR1_9ACTN
MTDPVTDHLDARYGRVRRAGRRSLLLALGGLLVLAGLAWLVWVAVLHSTPPVASRLIGFEIVSPSAAKATIEVERSDDVTAAACRVQAKAPDFSVVGEVTVNVAAGGPQRQMLTADVTTQRAATAVVLIGCTTPGSDRPR